MRVIVTFELPTSPDYTDQDVIEAVEARLDEFYPGADGYPALPANLRVAVASPAALTALLAAADVGLETAPEDLAGADEAFDVVNALRA